MRIDADLNNAIREYGRQVEFSRSSRTQEGSTVARLNLGNRKYIDEQYGMDTERRQSIEDILGENAYMDTKSLMDRMIVMTNTMSSEDLERAYKDGFDISSMSVEESVTILDHIKAVMAQSGSVIAGFNDDIDCSVLKEVTGDTLSDEDIAAALRESDLPDSEENIREIRDAYDIVKDIDKFPDSSISFMIRNRLRPTIENIYMARYSATEIVGSGSGQYFATEKGYLAKKGSIEDIDKLNLEIEKAILEFHPEKDTVNEEELEDGRWLISNGLTLTEDNLNRYRVVSSIAFPIKADKIIKASINAMLSLLPAVKGDLTKDDSIYARAERRLNEVEGRLSIAKATLRLSLDASIRAEKQGLGQINDIMDEISLLESEEQELRNLFLSNVSDDVDTVNIKADLYTETNDYLTRLPFLPAATLGRLSVESSEITLRGIVDEGTLLKQKYDLLSNTYETVKTEVRKDLGDSIAKAFNNVDDILRDMNLDISEENRRAVRILGYNSMVITEENLKNVKEVDAQVQSLINRMKPAAVLQMIREGINPLDMNITEVVGKLNELDMAPDRRGESMSRFLYKLDKSKEITDSERESYVGIYRLVNNLKSEDYAALGRVIESGEELTLRNVLKEIRSEKRSYDIRIDDSFGLLDSPVGDINSISAQIEAAFAGEHRQENEELNREYEKQAAESMKEAVGADEAIFEALKGINVAVTPANLSAMTEYMTAPGSFIKNLLKLGRSSDEISGSDYEEELLNKINDFFDSMTDKESTQKSYDDLLDTMTDILSNATLDMSGEGDTIDIRTMSLMYKQIALNTQSCVNESYHIPVVIGDSVTDINLTVISDSDNPGVDIKLDMGKSALIEAHITLDAGKVSLSHRSVDGEDGEFVKRIEGVFAKKCSEMTDIDSVDGSVNSLYRLAKVYIEAVKTEG